MGPVHLVWELMICFSAEVFFVFFVFKEVNTCSEDRSEGSSQVRVPNKDAEMDGAQPTPKHKETPRNT